RQAVESLFSTLRKFEHGLAGTLSGQIRYNVFLARARGYDTALDAYLHKDDIDPAVYRNLVATVNANLSPLHRYMRLRKQIMGVEELYIYDLYTPMVESVKMEVPYDQAVEILPKALAPLGQDYLAVLKEGLDPANGWIDVYPHKDKDSGAFSASVYGVHPYVKMNYFNEVGDLSTLAHEYGHALHSHLSMKNQPYVSASYAAFNAEIASTLNEKLLSDYLVANAKTDAEKLYLLNELVETIRTTIYRQTLFAEFELAVHTAAEKGTPLTAEFFNDTYGKLVRTYYGEHFTVGENDVLEWGYIPHFYFKYYVFTYATGLSAGIALAERVQTGGPEARGAYLGMLEGGSSKPPLELLRDAGVDLTKPHAIESAAKLLDATLAQMEQLLAKRSNP
ncbi:MAG: M3 family oligoendopeptidase, partial [Myxococcota bacterium]